MTVDTATSSCPSALASAPIPRTRMLFTKASASATRASRSSSSTLNRCVKVVSKNRASSKHFVSPLRILSCGLCGISGELEGCYRRLGDREVSDTLYDVQWQMIKAVYGDNECPYPLEDFYQEALI